MSADHDTPADATIPTEPDVIALHLLDATAAPDTTPASASAPEALAPVPADTTTTPAAQGTAPGASATPADDAPTPGSPIAFDRAVAAVRAGAAATAQAEVLYDLLTDDERLGLLDGDTPFWEGIVAMGTIGYNTEPIVEGAVDRLGVPGLRFSDGPRGAVVGHSTCFPVPMARGATWDVDLEERIGTAIGAEVRAQGANFFGGVCINLPRHPAWGRAQETYGEDPIVLGEMGAALTRGVRRNAMACVKHFACNSIENARFTVDVHAEDEALHEVYLAHFRRVVEEGADAVMTAYNAVNGQWCGQSPALITDVLRGRWGFQGVAVSDFILGLRNAAESLRAGLDVEEPFRQQRARDLPDDLASGRASWADVRSAGLRILATQLRYAAAMTHPAPSPDVVACPEHRALAREAAARAMVLLRNEPVDGAPLLPLDVASIGSLALIGRLADLANTGDHGSSDVRPPEVVTPLAGLRAALPGVDIRVVAEDDPAAAAEAAAACDLAVVVAGYTAADEGEYTDMGVMAGPGAFAFFPAPPEGMALPGMGGPAADGAGSATPADGAAAAPVAATGGTSSAGAPTVSAAGAASLGMGGDRRSLRLREVDERIVLAVAAAQPRTVVAVVAAGAVITEAWREAVPATLMAWYAGMEGGHALAEVLLGRAEPTGRLPFSVPTEESHLPFFDPQATEITYDRWHGQRLLDRLGVPAAYPLGFGLSYTSFAIESVQVERTGEETLEARVVVRNTGDRDGRHVVQLYGAMTDGPRAGERNLLGFAAVALPAGQSLTVPVSGSLRPVAPWDPEAGRQVVPGGVLRVQAAAHAGDPEAASAEVVLG